MPTTPRQRLSGLFHRRDHNSREEPSPYPPSSGSASSAPSPIVATGPGVATKGVRKMSSIRSLRDKFESKVRRKQSFSQGPAEDQGPDTSIDPSPFAQVAAASALRQHHASQYSQQPDLPTAFGHLDLNQTHDKSVSQHEFQQGAQYPRHLPSDAGYRLTTDIDTSPNAFAGFDPTAYDPSLVGGLHDLPAPLRVGKSSSFSRESPVSPVSPISAEYGLPRKSGVPNLRQPSDLQDEEEVGPPVPKHAIDPSRRSLKRKSLQKPLPRTPGRALPQDNSSLNSDKHDLGDQNLSRGTEHLGKDAGVAAELRGVIDLSDTVDTTVHETWAPAVTHEMIQHNVHEIRQEVVTREIHNYEIFHRILPITEVEVLPARHFVPVKDGYAEISADQLPDGSAKLAHRVLSEAAAKASPTREKFLGPRQFTARRFEGTEGDSRTGVTDEGFARTETTWVHPPTLETGGFETGQTLPLHLGRKSSTSASMHAAT